MLSIGRGWLRENETITGSSSTLAKSGQEIKKRRITKIKLKGVKGIALLVTAVLLLIASMAAIPATAGEERHEEFRDKEFRMDARYWWQAPLFLTDQEQQQLKVIGVLIFEGYFGTDISRMSPKEFDELWNAIGHEKQEKATRLFAQYATGKGFEIPGLPTPREEFIPPADATYWWEFVDPEHREGAINWAREEIPEMLRSYWELAEWKGVELPIPRPEEVDVMRLTPEEHALIFTPPSFPLGRVPIEEWLNRVFPGANIIAVFGRIPRYSGLAEWVDRLLKVDRTPLFPLQKSRIICTTGILAAGYIAVWLDCGVLTVEEAAAIAPKIYAMIAAKAEIVGVQDVPVVFVLESMKTVLAGTAKDPRDHLGTHLPLDQKFRPIPGGAQVKRGSRDATVGFAIRRRVWFLWDKDLTTTGHLGLLPVPVNTRVYQPTELAGNKVGTVADVARHGFADVARVATLDGDVIPYVRTMTFWTAPVTGWRDPIVPEWSGKFGRTTGRTSGNIYAVGIDTWNDAFGLLRNQIWATIRVELGDSGSPLFISGPGGGVAVTGITWGRLVARPYMGLFSPVSGVRAELPGWEPHTK